MSSLQVRVVCGPAAVLNVGCSRADGRPEDLDPSDLALAAVTKCKRTCENS